MSARELEPAPKLAPPGAGVPAYQRLAGKYVLLPIWRRIATPARAPGCLERQAREILAIADGWDEERRERCVLVPPQRGLEDSSRYYSWALVVEHLAIVNGALASVLVALAHGRVPPGAVRTAALKPKGEHSVDAVVERYRNALSELRAALGATDADWDAPTRYAHPWFGPLGPRSWAAFGPFHQAIHLRQAREIQARIAKR